MRRLEEEAYDSNASRAKRMGAVSEETPTYWTPLTRSAATGITPPEAEELRELYSELPVAAEAAREALGIAGPLPTGLQFGRFMEIQARIVEIVLRIEQILAQ
jgi:hypothetical protein